MFLSKMADSSRKLIVFSGWLLLFISCVAVAKKCPKLAKSSSDTAHADSVNKRVQKLADHGQFRFDDDGKKYSYTVNYCQDHESQIAVQQEDLIHPKHDPYTIGRYDGAQVIGGSTWLMITYFGDSYNQHCGSSKKRAIFLLECDQSADTHSDRMPKIITEYATGPKTNNSFCYYLFEAKDNAACLPMKTKISPGSVFIIIIVIIMFLYLLLGFLYQRFIVGAKGLEQIPNYIIWREFGSLQADGCNYFCRCKTSREPTRYKPMDDAIADDDTDGSERDDTLLPV